VAPEAPEAPVTSLVKPYLVISRALLRHVRLTLPPLPSNRVESAIRLQLISLSPHANNGFAWQQAGEQIYVYFWDQQKIERQIAQQDLAPSDVIPVPEPFIRALPTTAVTLRSSLEGYEALQCQDGAIIASRWWPHLPTYEEWLIFCRDIGAIALSLPTPSNTSDWQEAPLADTRLENRKAGFAISEAFMLQAVVLVTGVALTMIGVRHAKLEWALYDQRNSISALESVVRNAIDQREKAETDARRAKQLIEEMDNGEAVTLLGHLAAIGIGDQSGILLRDFEMRPGFIRIALTTTKEQMPRAQILERLGKLGVMEDLKLSVDSDPKTLIVEAKLLMPMAPFPPSSVAPPPFAKPDNTPTGGKP